MKALCFSEHGAIDRLALADVPSPLPRGGEVRIVLRSAALNHLDLFVLQGLPGLTLEFPHVGGADGAGVIAEIGAGVSGWREGDEVVFNPGLWCGSCEFCRRGDEALCVRFRIIGEHSRGTFAEEVCVPAANLSLRPSHLSWEEAAAFPLTFLTAWRMLVTRARVSAGETVLVHGIGGGVALAALAIAKHLGASVFVTSSSDEKLAHATALGADAAINYATKDVGKEIRALTGKRGVDVVIETTGLATWMTSLRACARGGRIVTCGATTGPNPAEEIRLIFWNQLSILGSTMGGARDWIQLVEAVQQWECRPVVDSSFPLESGRQAYERLASGNQFGKVVMVIGS